MTVEPTIHTPQHLAPAPVHAAPVVPVVLPQHPMTVAYLPGTDGRMVAAYVPVPAPAPPADQPGPRTAAVSPLLINAVLGSGAFALTSLGLYLLDQFIEALAHLVYALVILAAIVCGAPVALQLLRALTGGSSQTVINAKRVKVGRIINRGR